MATQKQANYFAELNAVDCNGKTEKKNGLTYLSWAYAWAELKKRHPTATSTVYENKDGWCYFTDGKTCWVKCGVTVDGIEHIEYLPVMDFRNKSIPADKVESMEVNKAIQRCITKAIARHGIGLYIYAGEDIPEQVTASPDTKPEDDAPVPSVNTAPAPEPRRAPTEEETTIINAAKDAFPGSEVKVQAYECACCHGDVVDTPRMKANKIAEWTFDNFGVILCADCAKKVKAGKISIETITANS